MWRPDISPLLPRWLLHYRDHLPLTSPFSPETLLVGVKKEKETPDTGVVVKEQTESVQQEMKLFDVRSEKCAVVKKTLIG